jgi:hypothetical protein
MSVNEVREKLGELSARYPKDLRLIRSGDEIDKVDLWNGDLHGPFDNGDTNITDVVEKALSAGKQVAVSAAGSNQVLVTTAKSGKTLFR